MSEISKRYFYSSLKERALAMVISTKAFIKTERVDRNIIIKYKEKNQWTYLTIY